MALGWALATGMFAADRQYTDVPFVPTPGDVVDAMLDLAGIQPNDVGREGHVRRPTCFNTTCARLP